MFTTKPDDGNLRLPCERKDLSCPLTSPQIPNSHPKYLTKRLKWHQQQARVRLQLPYYGPTPYDQYIDQLRVICSQQLTCSVLGPRPGPLLSPPNPHPCLDLPGMKWRHLEGDNLSAACTQGPDHLMAHRVCGTPGKKPKR